VQILNLTNQWLFSALRLEPKIDNDLFFPNVHTDLEGTAIRAGNIAKAPSGGSYGERRLPRMWMSED
jgi:hypothetical protein